MSDTMAAPKRHYFKKMGAREGDKTTSWDKGKPDEVEVAEAEFDELVGKKGYRAYEIDPATGGKGREIKKFDPNVEKMLLVPVRQMAGG